MEDMKIIKDMIEFLKQKVFDLKKILFDTEVQLESLKQIEKEKSKSTKEETIKKISKVASDKNKESKINIEVCNAIAYEYGDEIETILRKQKSRLSSEKIKYFLSKHDINVSLVELEHFLTKSKRFNFNSEKNNWGLEKVKKKLIQQ